MTIDPNRASAFAVPDRMAWEGALQAYRFAHDAKGEGDSLDFLTALTNLIATPAPNAFALRLKVEAMFEAGDCSPERRKIILDDLLRIDTEDTVLLNAWQDYVAATTLLTRQGISAEERAAGSAKIDVADTVLLGTPARTRKGTAVKLRRALTGLLDDRFARLIVQNTNTELAEQIGEIDDTPGRLIASAIRTLEAAK